ncbi:MCE family protein [bacterium]|nr:MCE family protein [bacterium]
MFSFYLIISLAAQFASGKLPVMPFQTVQVTFEQLNGLKTGSPVYLESSLVGTVSQIDYELGVDKSNKKNGKFVVELALHVSKEKVTQSTIGLITERLAPNAQTLGTGVELLVGVGNTEADSQAVSASRLQGYSSFSDFWKSKIPA